MKINRKYWLFPIYLMGVLLWHQDLLGQTDKFVDKVQLTNGSVIWGLSEMEGDQLKVFLSSEDSITIPASYIKTLKKRKLNPELYQERLQGIYYQLSAGVLVGKSYQFSDNETSFSASFASGFKFNRLWGLGLGLGVDFYPEQRHMPLFLEVQGDLLRGRVSPFYQLRTGWSWAQERNAPMELEGMEGGFYIKPAVGVRWHFARYSWHLAFSYLRQESTTRYEPLDFGNGNIVTNVENRTLQRLGISIGITF